MKTANYEEIDFSTEPWASYLWGAPGQEDLDPDVDRLIEELAENAGRIDGTLTLHAWIRHVIDESEIKRLAHLALGELYERLDEKYGDPEDPGQEPDEEDERRTVEWVKAIIPGFKVWSCDETDQRVEVDVGKWAAIKAPHWLEEGA